MIVVSTGTNAWGSMDQFSEWVPAHLDVSVILGQQHRLSKSEMVYQKAVAMGWKSFRSPANRTDANSYSAGVIALVLYDFGAWRISDDQKAPGRVM